MSTFSLSPARLERLIASLAITALVSGSLSVLFIMQPSVGIASHSQCSDGVDNDSDGRTDYPNDGDCENIDDMTEGTGGGGFFLSLTDGRDSVAPGGSVVYRIELTQTAATERTVDVDFTLPARATLSSASDGGRFISGGHIRWDDVSVYRQNSRVLTVTVNVDPSAREDEILAARVSADGTQATDTTRIFGTSVDNGVFSVSVTDGQTYVLPGERLTYTVRVRNDKTHAERTDVRVTLPQFATYLNGSAGVQRIDNNALIWRDQFFEQDQERTYSFTVEIYDRVTERYSLRATAYVGNRTATDETYTNRGLPDAVLRLSITDNRDTVERGQLLTYYIDMDNTAHDVGTDEFVTAGLPIYAEFIDASDGGVYDGQNIRWDHLKIAPKGTRRIAFTFRVRADAPIGQELRTSARTDGGVDGDITTVVKNSNERSSSSGYGRTPTDPSRNTRNEDDVLFRKVASTDEIVPGGFIRYTIYVRNTQPHALRALLISDRFDAQYLTFANGNPSFREDNRLEWRIPDLDPGEEWETTYTLAVAPNAPKDIDLTNVATISGDDIRYLSLTERVRTVRTGVIRSLPTTGAPIDLLFTMISLSTTGAAAGLELMKRRFM